MKWYNKNCFAGGHGVCWFDKYSFLHFGNLGFIYAILLLIGLIKNINMKWSLYLFLIINIIHIIDEILNNYTDISTESIWVPKHLGKVPRDGDSIQNFLGDLISGFVGSSLVLLTFYLTQKTIYQPLIILFTGFGLFCIGMSFWLNM